MFRMMLLTQWKWSRLLVALCALAGFAIAPITVQALADPQMARWEMATVLTQVSAWGLLYPLVAAGAGLTLALTTWSQDHAGRHVYALSLPVPRWHYALLRFGAGAVLLAGVTLFVLLGALVAVATIHLPAGLVARPFGIALRFGLAALVAYSAFFAISAGTNRTAGFVLLLLGGIIVLQIAAAAVDVDLDIGGVLLRAVFLWPGPLEVFSGRWMLVDV